MIGKYRVIRVLGAGSAGVVYLVSDDHLNKLWALKAITQNETRQRDGIRILKKLSHPSLPRVVEEFNEADVSYAVMDYIEGKNLATVIKTRSFRKDEILSCGIMICDIFTYLHSQKPPVIYRDLKPSNVIFTKDGRLSLIDFDSAVEGEQRNAVPVGTKGYASFEQRQGICGTASDIYSIGAILKTLAGTRKFRGLARITRKAMRRDPEKRYQSAQKMGDKLRGLRKRTKAPGRIPIVCILLILTAVFMLINKDIASDLLGIRYEEAIRTGDYIGAIHIRPEEESLYRILLINMEEEGKTEEGIALIESLRRSFPDETKNHGDIMMDIGMLYLDGSLLDPDFSKDYAAAEKIFRSIPKAGSAKASSCLMLAHMLNTFSDEVDWAAAAQCMKALTLTSADEKASEVIKRKLMLSDLYLSYSQELAGTGGNPYETAINLLITAKDLLPKADAGIRDKLSTGLFLRLGRASYTCGLMKNGEEARSLFQAARIAYAKVENSIPKGYGRVRFELSYADVLRALSDWTAAEEYYEKILAEIKGGEELADLDGKAAALYTETVCSYAMMELYQCHNETKTEELLASSEEVTGVLSDPGVRIIEDALEENDHEP